MIGGFLGGLANAGAVVKGADEAQAEQLKRALIAMELRRAQEQDQANAAAYRGLSALPSIGQRGGIPGGGLPQGMPPGQVQQQPLLSPSMRQVPPQQAGLPGGRPQGDMVTPNLAGSGVDWQNENPEFQQRVGSMLAAAPQGVRDASAVDSGYRTTPQQAEIYERSGQGTKFMAAPPGKSLHEQGLAADWTFKNPEADKWVHQNAGQYGLEFPLGPRDPNHMQMVKQELMKTGVQAVRAGYPPPAVRESMSTAKDAASDLDPARFGSYGLPEIAQAIEKTSPDAPPAVKYLAAAQLHKLMAPDQQQMLKLLMQQQKNDLTTAFKSREFDIRERNLAEREQHDRAMEGRPTAADTHNYVPYDVPGQPPRLLDTKTGKVTSAPELEGASKIGTGARNMGRWSDDAMEALVVQGMKGDPSIMQKLPRSGPARQQYEEALAAKLKSMEGGIEGGTSAMMMNQMRMAEARSAAHTAGRVTMNTELFSREAVGAGQQVIETSKLFPRTGVPLVNAALAAYEQNTGDPNVIRFGAAIFSLLNAYGKMSNPTGTGIHDVDKQRLADILDRRATQGQVEAAVQQIITEGKVVSDAAFHAQEDVLKRIVPGGGGQPPASPSSASGGQPAGGQYNTEADIMRAIESGGLSKEDGTKLLIDKFGWRQ